MQERMHNARKIVVTYTIGDEATSVEADGLEGASRAEIAMFTQSTAHLLKILLDSGIFCFVPGNDLLVRALTPFADVKTFSELTLMGIKDEVAKHEDLTDEQRQLINKLFNDIEDFNNEETK